MIRLYSKKSALVFALAMMANVALAQSFKVTSNGNPVSNNDVIELPCEFEDFSEGGEYMAVYTWNPHLDAVSTGGSTALSVSVTPDENADGVTICWPSSCAMVSPGKTLTNNGTITNEPADLQIHREVYAYSKEEGPTEVGTVKVEVSSGSETMVFTIKCLLPVGNVANEQSFKVTSNGNPVSNNEVIELPCEFEEFSEGGEYMAVYTWNPHLDAVSTGGSTALSVSVTPDENADGVTICWPSSCAMVSPGKTLTNNGTITNEPADLQIHREVYAYSKEEGPTEVGTVKVEVSSGSETMVFTIKCLLPVGNGVAENLIDENAASEYYTIQGVKVAEPQKGQLYIERKGQKVTKRVF